MHELKNPKLKTKCPLCFEIEPCRHTHYVKLNDKSFIKWEKWLGLINSNKI